MITIEKSVLENLIYSGFSNGDLKNKFAELKMQKLDCVILSVVQILIEKIKRIYDYEFTDFDLDILNDFINQVSLDISSMKAYYPFLIYTILCHLENSRIHCLFLDDFSARKYFEKSAKLYSDLNIGASFNININVDKQIKDKIYSYNIIFSDWRRIGFDKIDNLNIKKAVDKFNLKFDKAFIFDIDRIIYDYEKLTLKIQAPNLAFSNIKVKKIFCEYKNIVGISPSLFFENEKIKKSYKIKTKLTTNSKEIINNLKNANEFFYDLRDEKIRNLAKHIESLSKNKETIVVDVDDKKDFEILEEYLKIKKINYDVIDFEKSSNEYSLYTILTSNKVTLMTNLMSAKVESILGGNASDIAKINVLNLGVEQSSNFYKEKYKKELNKQIEIQENHAKTITKQGGINLIFASHYTELKYEYLILKNYFDIQIKNVSFYNSSEDEVFKEYKMSNLNIFQKAHTQENQILFKIFAKFIFYLRKYSINKFFVQQKGYMYYAVSEKQEAIKQIKKEEKPKRNDPCPCGSGLKYKNCCGK